MILASGVGVAPLAYGWGFEGHALITRKACASMPAPLRGFYQAHRDELAQHASDPDRWRRSDDPAHAGEGPRHFLDIDYEAFGRYPFHQLPRDYGEAAAEFGEETFEKYGTLPWRIDEYLDVVADAMRSGDPKTIVSASAAHAHYVQDAHMPLHTVVNSNGQLTGQDGVHRRWESAMVERYLSDLDVLVVPQIDQIGVLEDPLDAAFETILESYVVHLELLHADRNASAGVEGGPAQSEAYLDRLWALSSRLCAARMSAAATRTAQYWLTAWDRAGRPQLQGSPLKGHGRQPRARDLGIRIGTLPTGEHNAITDVAGVRVGHRTLVSGDGADAIRTGVTAIVPREDIWHRNVPAATFAFNGNGEMMGAAYVDEVGWLEVPILLTGTLNVPRVADGVIAWMTQVHPPMGLTDDVVLPLVAECSDAWLTNAPSRPITDDDVVAAIEGAEGGVVEEGAVGAGAGMISYSYKGGCGTASRVAEGYTIGAFVLANGGRRPALRIDGVPVGRVLTDAMPETVREDGSFIIAIATDAPMTSRQLRRLCKRATFGLARTGTAGRHGSGDFVIAFSTGVVLPHSPEDATQSRLAFSDGRLNAVFTATVEATEEAIVNALVAGRTVTGRDGHTAYGLPHDDLRRVMYHHGRLQLMTADTQ